MLEILIDKLTNSIEEVATGRTWDTDVSRVAQANLKSLGPEWRFNWKTEFKIHELYKLTIPNRGPEIEGLISLTRMTGFVQVMLIENHPRNVGRKKKFVGVAGNLMAYAAKLSFELGNEGYIAFDANGKNGAIHCSGLASRTR